MVKFFCKNLKYVVDILWFIGFCIVISISFYLTSLIFELLSNLNFFNNAILYGLSVYAFINIYILVCGVLFRIFVPSMKEGHYSHNSKQFLYWRLNWHFYSYIFLFFRLYLFYTPFMRYITLRLFRVNLKYSTYIAETADFQDCNNLITIGEGSGIGSEVLLSTHLAISPSVSIQKRLTIGDNTHIQAKVCLAPGVEIGNDSIIGFATMLSLGAKVGNNTRIGACSLIDVNCRVGNNCRIGHNVVLSEGLSIGDNTVIPDFMKIPRVKDENGKIITLINKNNVHMFFREFNYNSSSFEGINDAS